MNIWPSKILVLNPMGLEDGDCEVAGRAWWPPSPFIRQRSWKVIRRMVIHSFPMVKISFDYSSAEKHALISVHGVKQPCTRLLNFHAEVSYLYLNLQSLRNERYFRGVRQRSRKKVEHRVS